VFLPALPALSLIQFCSLVLQNAPIHIFRILQIARVFNFAPMASLLILFQAIAFSNAETRLFYLLIVSLIFVRVLAATINSLLLLQIQAMVLV
jgi:hypothetical protein